MLETTERKSGKEVNEMRSPNLLFVLALIAFVLLPGCGGEAGEKKEEEKKAEPAGFKATIVLESPAARVVKVYFLEGLAIETQNDQVSARFDLDTGTFEGVRDKRTVTLMEAIAWGQERSRLVRETLANEEDTPTRRLRELFVDPEFVAKEAGELLVIENEMMMYRIAPAEITQEQARLFSQYNRLNAYLRSMMADQFPPGVQLGITNELESRGLAPRSMYIETSGSEPVSITYTYEPLTDEETKLARGWLAN
jgi:hypothetical protein